MVSPYRAIRIDGERTMLLSQGKDKTYIDGVDQFGQQFSADNATHNCITLKFISEIGGSKHFEELNLSESQFAAINFYLATGYGKAMQCKHNYVPRHARKETAEAPYISEDDIQAQIDAGVKQIADSLSESINPICFKSIPETEKTA